MITLIATGSLLRPQGRLFESRPTQDLKIDSNHFRDLKNQGPVSRQGLGMLKKPHRYGPEHLHVA